MAFDNFASAAKTNKKPLLFTCKLQCCDFLCSVIFVFCVPLLEIGTVVAARFAHLFLVSPTLIAMYYLPYENGELKKIVLFTWHCNSLE